MAAPAVSHGATLPTGFEETTVASNLSGPTAIAWAPDGRMFIAEKAGRVKVLTTSGSVVQMLDISNHVHGVGDHGLLGIAADSDFANNHYLYLLYVYMVPGSGGSGPRTSRLTRVTVNDDNTASGETVLLGSIGTPPCPTPNNAVDCIPADEDSHAIGTVRSAPDGTLWLGSGDAASWSRVDPVALRTYDEQTMAGKILHVDRNGLGLTGHPFCPADNDLTHVCTKLYAKGLRNPFRFTLRPAPLGPVVGDVGWETWEEIDLLSPGKNYGWPCYEGLVHTSGYKDLSGCTPQYQAEGTANAATPPIFVTAHSDEPNFSSAIVGGPFYPGGPYPDDFDGSMFYGNYAAKYIKRLTFDANGNVTGTQPFATNWPGVDLELGPGNLIYYTNFADGSNGTGSVRKISYVLGGNSTPIAAASATTPISGPVPLDVTFSSTGSSDPDNDPLTYEWDFGDGTAHSSLANPTHRYSSATNATATLTVRDGKGGQATATVKVFPGNDPPNVTINSPADNSSFLVGDTINLNATVTDNQDGQLTGDALSWHVILIHNTHVHDLGFLSGETPSFPSDPNHDADSFYKVVLTATDSRGQTDTKTIKLFPQAVNLTLDSSPPGAPLTYAGATNAAPWTRAVAVGFNGTISAAQTFTAGGTNLRVHRLVRRRGATAQHHHPGD